MPGCDREGLEGVEEAFCSEAGRPGFPRGEFLHRGERIALKRIDGDLEVLAQLAAGPADDVQALACSGQMVGAFVLAV